MSSNIGGGGGVSTNDFFIILKRLFISIIVIIIHIWRHALMKQITYIQQRADRKSDEFH